MKNLAEKLRNYTETDYANNKIDLHIHTLFSDGHGNYEQILKSAKEKGYELISITDHNTVEAHHKINDEILLTGAEFDCWFGYVYIHLLAYGIDINNEDFKKFLAKNKQGTDHVIPRLLTFRDVKKLIKAIHSAGGIAVLAHPACCWALNLERMIKSLMNIGLDGIEVFYPYPRFRGFVKFHSAQTVKDIADKYPELIQTGGTDFHGEKF
jgi:predicted metal-dependent phosphoesterase TrpH